MPRAPTNDRLCLDALRFGEYGFVCCARWLSLIPHRLTVLGAWGILTGGKGICVVYSQAVTLIVSWTKVRGQCVWTVLCSAGPTLALWSGDSSVLLGLDFVVVDLVCVS